MVLVSAQLTCGMIPGWSSIICPTRFMSLGLVYEGFLVDPFYWLTLVLYGLFWYFTNRKYTQGGIFMTFIRLLGVIPLLDNIIGGFKVQCFSLSFQTGSSLLYSPKISLVDQKLSIPSLVINIFPLISSWWEGVMVSWLGLVGLLQNPGYFLRPKP